MAFPQDILPILVELDIDGTWTDITSDVRADQAIRITRGRADESGQVSPGRCALTLNNRDGRYSPRNPSSPYYGLIGRNTPIRVSVDHGDPYLSLPGALGDHASTPDDPALDITGDIDVRVDGAFTNLLDATDILDTVEVIGKFRVSTNDRSWVFGTRSGLLYFEWSADGTNTTITQSTTAPRPGPGERLAIRATLDVDNGAGGNTVTFYTAPSGTSGPWTQLGDPVTNSGTTSIYSGVTDLRIGDATTVGGFDRATGRCYAAEIRSGIDGTAVANPDFTAQTIGDTSFVDDAGRTWTLGGATAITNRHTRFSGEVSSWPAKWSEGGRDVWTPIDASGLLRRLGQGAKALDSALRRRLPTGNPLAYWPMEEPAGATEIYSPISTGRVGRTTGMTFGADSDLPASSPLPTLGSAATLEAGIDYTPPTGEWMVSFVYKIDEVPGADAEWIEVRSSGAARRITTTLTSAGGITTTMYDEDETVLVTFNTAVTGFEFYGTWNRFEMRAAESAGTVTLKVRWIVIGGDAYEDEDTYSGTAGRVTSVRGTFGSELQGSSLGHLAVWDSQSSSVYNRVDQGFAGESAWDRIERLADEENLPVVMGGNSDLSVAMGPQEPETLLTLLEECAEADHGILFEDRNTLALRYLPRDARYNRPTVLTLDYSASGLVLPLDPVDDDQNLRNDVTASRPGGTSARYVQTEGPLSTEAPPDGVGLYDTAVTVNVQTDEQLPGHAAQLVHHGTWDEARYPRVNLNLAAGPVLIDDALLLDVGERAAITGPPAWLPPEDIGLLVEGYTETLAQYQWELQLNCSPGRVWDVGVVEDSDEDLGRVDTDGSELVNAVTATDSEFIVHTPAVDDGHATPWITTDGRATNFPSEFPFDVQVGGEVITVTACEPLVWDAFTRIETDTWGTASSGHAWTEEGGLTTDRSANGSAGVITLFDTPGTIRFQYLQEVLGDCEVLASVTPDQLATGNSFLPSVLLRINVNYYRVQLRLDTAGGVGLDLLNTGTAVGSAVTTPYTYAGGTKVWVRARVVGHQVLARAWTGSVEPSWWFLDETVAADTIDSGGVGVSTSAFGSNTNVDPAFAWDDYQIVSPQTMTVTRSVNGVEKAHAAGADLRLAYPTYVAL